MNRPLTEICLKSAGLNPMIFVATVGFWMKKTLQSLRRRNTRTLSTKTRISEQSTNLKQPNLLLDPYGDTFPVREKRPLFSLEMLL